MLFFFFFFLTSLYSSHDDSDQTATFPLRCEILCCGNQCHVMLGLKLLSERSESGCIFYESAAASARKLTVSGKPSVKSDPHLYAELLTGKMKFSDASVIACDGLENDCHLSLLSFPGVS